MTFNEVLNRKCPCCQKKITLSDRLVLLNRETVHCRYCAKSLKPDFKIMLFNMLWFSMSVSWLIKNLTSLEYFWALAIAFLSAHIILPAIDLLFPLEEETWQDL